MGNDYQNNMFMLHLFHLRRKKLRGIHCENPYGSYAADQMPKQITTSEPPQNPESQPASVSNPFKWMLTYQNRFFVRFLSKASGFRLKQRFIGKEHKVKSRMTGKFPQKRGQMVFVDRIKPVSPGQETKSY